MKYILIILIFINVYIFIVLPNKTVELEHKDSIGQPSGYEQAYRARADYQESECRSESEYFDITIKVDYVPDNDEYAGQWNPAENLILLNEVSGIDISTVAHEVYHMVQTKMREYEVEDPHYGAYLQGAFTECVWSLVERNVIDERRRGLFRFAP